MLEEIGFSNIEVSPQYDTFGEAKGQAKARHFDVYGYTFLAVKPG